MAQRPSTAGPRVRAPVRDKVLSPSWVEEQLAGTRFRSLYEPFAGTALVGRYFKRRGKRVVTSDLLEGHYCFGLALVENEERYVSPGRMQEWLTLIKDPRVATRFSPWANRYVTPEEAIWLGVWHAHLSSPDLTPVERALGAVAVHFVLKYWWSFNRQELGPKPMTPAVVFQHYLQTVNTWVCSNGLANQALCGDAHVLAPEVEADLLFCYPPTDQGFFDTPDFPWLFESWVKGEPALVLPGLSAEPTTPSLGLPLAEPEAYASALRAFLSRASHFPVWALAFNDRYPLDEAAMAAIVQEFRPVSQRAHFKAPAPNARTLPPTEFLLVAPAK